jgi:hypothetical protein
MITKVWRERLAYTAMSLFVAWHTLVMVVAPAPENSDIVKGLRTVFAPYLQFFRLDNQWDFFAPEVGKNSVLRYVIKDASGVGHTFQPATKLNWFHPSYIWFRDWYLTLMDTPDDFGEAFAALFCREHAALNPVSITFQEIEEQDYGPEDRLRGKQPLDPQFVKVNLVKNYPCPQ